MKKGVILYLVGGREPAQQEADLREQQRRLGVDAVYLATSEFEISYNWWRLFTRGMQEISCMRATYDEERRVFSPQGRPLRLCG